MAQQETGQTVDRPNEGVRLYVPSQPGITVNPRLDNYDSQAGQKTGYSSPSTTSDFTVIRALVDFELPASPNVETFTKPARLTVCYKQSDANAAGGADKLKLGAWDGKKWRILPRNRAVPNPFPSQDFAGAVEANRPHPDRSRPIDNRRVGRLLPCLQSAYRFALL
jgi:hypothetical protein